jgi:DNA mismatch repair ATPase MutS
MLSDQVIEDLVHEVVAEMGALFDCSESVWLRTEFAEQIAILDLLASFANVARGGKYVRPEFGDGYMVSRA